MTAPSLGWRNDTIAVGDVHGNLAALDDILNQVRHESARGVVAEGVAHLSVKIDYLSR
jgi:hypothetical protein